MQQCRRWGAGRHEGVGGGGWVGKCMEASGHISQGQETWVGVRRDCRDALVWAVGHGVWV